MKPFQVPDNDDFYGPSPGHFGRLTKRKVNWHSCRETFDDKRTFPKEFLFCFRYDTSAEKTDSRVHKFMDEIQDRLKLKKKERLKFRKTDVPNVMYVRTSKFWRQKASRALLTILLRAGRQFAGNFQDAIDGENYLFRTQTALKEFLKGRTKVKKTAPFYGWVAAFQDADIERVNEVLAKGKKCQ
jgi:hypothetical protein